MSKCFEIFQPCCENILEHESPPNKKLYVHYTVSVLILAIGMIPEAGKFPVRPGIQCLLDAYALLQVRRQETSLQVHVHVGLLLFFQSVISLGTLENK